MRTNADRASRGQEAYDAVTHDDNDTVTNIYDLVCDLLHFADCVPADDLTGDCGEYVAEMALFHYRAEKDES
jgi:hypothetical protein